MLTFSLWVDVELGSGRGWIAHTILGHTLKDDVISTWLGWFNAQYSHSTLLDSHCRVPLVIGRYSTASFPPEHVRCRVTRRSTEQSHYSVLDDLLISWRYCDLGRV